MLDDLDPEHPDEADVLELRRLLYGLHAILRLHFAQEEEGYFSLLDDPEEARDARSAPAPRGGREVSKDSLAMQIHDPRRGT